MPTYSLTLRQNLDRKLISLEVDNNFLYLQNLIYSGTGSGFTFSQNIYNNWQTIAQNGSLNPGTFIEITDRADNGIILYCASTSSFALEGTGAFINADYQSVGNYLGIEGFISTQGLWATSSESDYINGNVVIWNNSHYLVTDFSEINGESPNNNPSAYFYLSEELNNGYIEEWDIIIYDFLNDNLKWRIDKRGNKISLYDESFQWGDDKIRSIAMSSYESYINIQNNSGYILGSLSGLNSVISISNNSNSIYFHVDGSSVAFYSQYNTGNIECHIEGFSSGLSTDSNSGDIRVYIYDSSYVSANNNSANIYASYQGNSQVIHDNNTSAIQYSEFVNSYISSLNSVYLYECSISGLIANDDDNYDFNGISGTWSNRYYTPYESTFDYQIDNTYITPIGLSPSDITWNSLVIPGGLSFIGDFSINLDQPYNIMTIVGNKEGLPVRLETTNYTFNIYSIQDYIIGNDGVLSTSYNTNTSEGTSPIFATDSYYSFMVYPIQFSPNSGISSFIELQRKSGNLSINRVNNYGGWGTNILPVVTTADITDIGFTNATGGGNVLSEGSSPVSARGVCINTIGNPTINDPLTTDGSGLGTFVSNITGMVEGQIYYVRAYAQNSSGVSYGSQISFETEQCLVEGTKILLSNRTYKNIEDIDCEDEIMTWNFDEGKFDISKPLWIMKPKSTNKYNLLKFSDGSELKTIVQHRIFNKEKGMFTYPMTDETPLHTTTFNSLGEEITLISKEVVYEEVNYYNIITDKNINLFANNILTSSKFNNIYPIVDMKFIKDNRVLRDRSEFINISDKYIDGLRLCEQTLTLYEINFKISIFEKNRLEYEIS